MARFLERRIGKIQVSSDRKQLTPGAFNDGFKGICSVFVTAAFSFAGTELAGLAAAETVFLKMSI
jgi:amino acid permease